MRIGDLFAGIGGFSLAARWVGWETAWYSEIEPWACGVMARHFPDAINHGDITKIQGADVAPVDLLCGGFPCQDISLAGKGAGIGGARSGLWGEFARLIGEIHPRWVVAENVSALRSRGLISVLKDLDALGYDAEGHCIPASAVGAPHQRDRIWIVARPRGPQDRIPMGDPGSEPLHLGRGRDSDPRRPSPDPDGRRHGDPVETVRPGRHGTLDGGDSRAPGTGREGDANVAYPKGVPERPGLRESDPSRERWGRPSDCGSQVGDDSRASMPDGHRDRLERVVETGPTPGPTHRPSDGRDPRWWLVEPDVGRVAYGVPSRVDRLRCLGNAIVPQVAYRIFSAIARADASLTPPRP